MVTRGEPGQSRQPDHLPKHPIDAFATSLRAACGPALHNVGRIVSQLQQRTAVQPRAFAAVSPPFSSVSQGAADPDPAKRKKKKKKRTKPVPERHETFSGATEAFSTDQPAAFQSPEPVQRQEAPAAASPKEEVKSSSKSSGFKLPAFRLPAVKLPGVKLPGMGGPRAPPEEETPESVRELDLVPEPAPANESEEIASQLVTLRENMTPEQRKRFDTVLWQQVAKRVKVEVDGTPMTLAKLAEKAREEVEFKEIGAGEPTLRKKPREQVLAEIPGHKLRPNAPKMQLRPEEHEALELDRFGQGHLFTERKVLGLPYGVLHDFAWGMFGRIPATQACLANWAGRDPQEVLAKQEYYDDILDNAAKMELTLMMVAERPIPLSRLRNGFLARQIEVMRRVPKQEHRLVDSLAPQHKLLLADIKRTYTVDALQESGVIDAQGNVVPDTKFFVTVGPQWQLTAEAVTAGPLKEQRGVQLGFWDDPTFARSVMENFLGMYPVDLRGKHSVGNGALFVANGFDFKPPELSPGQAKTYRPDDYYLDMGTLAQEAVPNSPDLFKLADAPQPLLLNGIARSRQPVAI